ncbi:MAG: selenium-dependent molybdenum cofactor biosynthesis protein YqeB [Anaerolineae bacterium]
MASAFFSGARVVVRGGGDLASGIIARLHRAGFPVLVLELPAPLLVRRAVSFGDAVYEGVRVVEDITARLTDVASVEAVLAAGEVPVLVDPAGHSLRMLRPVVVVDARMEKRNPGTHLGDAPLVIALGPGFTAGVDCHVVIETNRGHYLGRALWAGSAEADTGEPGSIGMKTQTRVLRAPADGHVHAHAQIGDVLPEGGLIADVAGVEIRAPFAGALRGLIHERVPVQAGMKVGDLDPRISPEHCFTISDKSLAIGGGVLEAVLFAPQVRARLFATT